MQKIEIYRFDRDDPPWDKRIDQAFNRLLEFAEELRRPDKKGEANPDRKAFNRFLGGEFDDSDITRLVEYAAVVADRAMKKYCQGPMAQAPWAQAVLQSADNLTTVMSEFVEWFRGHECHYDREPGAM